MAGILPFYYAAPTSTSSGTTSSSSSGSSTAKCGNITFTTNSTQDTFVIPHGLKDANGNNMMPSYANVVAKNPTAIGDYSVVWDSANITMMYNYAPPSGTIVLTWIVVQ